MPESISNLMSKPRRWLSIGWMPGPSDIADERRWSDAVPRMAAALAEVGHPAKFAEVHPKGFRHTLLFGKTGPDDAVLLKAAELCGVVDLMRHLLEDGCKCSICKLADAHG